MLETTSPLAGYAPAMCICYSAIYIYTLIIIIHQPAEEHSDYWTVIIIAATVSLVLLTLIFFVKHPGAFNFFDRYQSKSLIHPSKIFVGREQEMSKLMDLLDFGSDTDIRIVNIVGSPGFGKSTLAIHIGDRMVKQGVEVHYINMDEYGQDIDIQIELAEKILKAADYSLDRYTFDDLTKWLRKLYWNSLIIIDDCDDLVHNNRTTFFHALGKMVEQTPRIKVLITSREVTIHLEYVRRYRIYELSKRASCELFEQILPVGINLTTTEIEEIAKLTGNAPLALQIVGALLSSPNPPSPSFIIGELNSHPINLLSHEDLQHEHKLNVSISLSYRYLSPEMQMISQYLAKFPGSFTLKAANAIVICGQAYPCLKNASQNDSPVTKTLRSLSSRSLIEFNLIKKQRYTFHRLIMEFLREMQVSDSNKAEFNSNFQTYYSSLLTQTIDIFEADYRLALHNLGIERHNYQKILYDLKAKNHDVVSFLDMITSITKAFASAIRILSFSFSDEEIMNSTLSALEYIEENHLLQKKLHINTLRLVYVTFVYEVIRIKKNMFGIKNALKIYTERESIVNSITVNKSNSKKSTEIIIYKQLAKLHEELDNHEKAKECHTQIFSLKRDLGSWCINNQCSFQEIGQLHYSVGFYEQSARYLELAYQHEEDSLTTMQKFYLLVDLARVNMHLNEISKVERYSREIHSILQDDLLTASEMYKHRSRLTTTIQSLQRVNPHIGIDLEAKLIEAVMDIESHANSTKCSQKNDHETLKVLEHYYEQKKYKKTIQLGKIVLKKLITCSEYLHVIHLTPKIRAKLLVAKAIFQTEGFSKGLDEMEQLLPDVLPLRFNYKKEFSEICSFLILRLSHIETCYPQVYSIPRYIAIVVVYTVFVIPLQHPYHNQEHKNFPSSPPKSTVPEIIMHSSSKEVVVSGEFELLNVDYLETFVPYITSVKDFFINNLTWLCGIIFQFSFSFQSIVIRFLLNTFTVFVRLYIFFLIFSMPLVISFSFWLYVFIRPFVIISYKIIFRFPNLFFFPSTLALINLNLQILEFLFACHQACLRIIFFGFNNHRWDSRRYLVYT